MKPPTVARWPIRRAIAVLLPVFVFYAMPLGFLPALPPGLESNHTFLAMALWERGATDVDVETADYFVDHDMLKVGGHYRSNQPPGPACWLVPGLAAVDAVTPGRPEFWRYAYAGRVLMLSLAFVVFLFVLGRSLERLAPPGVAWGLVLAYGLATNAGIYATRYFGHDLAAIAHGAAFIALLRGRGRPLAVLVAALLAGCGVACEYRTVGIAVVVAVTAVVFGDGRRLLRAALVVLGAALPAVALIAYRNAAFHVDTVSIASGAAELERFGVDAGWLGFTGPTLERVLSLLGSPAIGLWFHAPWLVLAVPATVIAIRRNVGPRAIVIAAAGAFCVHFVLVASHAFWVGGATTGPRYLTAALPLLLFPLAAWLGRPNTSSRVRLAAGAGAVGAFAFHLVVAMTTPLIHIDADQLAQNPLRAFAFPLLSDGRFALTMPELLGASPGVAIAVLVLCAVTPIVLWASFQRIGIRAGAIGFAGGAIVFVAQSMIGAAATVNTETRRATLASASDRSAFPRRDGRIAFPPRPAAIAPRPADASIERFAPESDRVLPASTKIDVVAEPFSFLRAPLWRDGALLIADVARNTIFRYDPRGTLEHVRYHSGYDGTNTAFYRLPGTADLAALPDGRVVEAEHGNRRVAWLDGKTIADRIDGKRFNSPNHVAVRRDGTIFFTDPPFGLRFLHDDPTRELDLCGVYRVQNGNVALVVDKLAAPTGLALSPDERYLYVGDWSTTKQVVRFTMDRASGFTDAIPFADLTRAPGAQGIDGLGVDASGNVYVCGPGGVWVFAPDGRRLALIRLRWPATDVAWGGADGRTLFITTHRALYRVTIARG